MATDGLDAEGRERFLHSLRDTTPMVVEAGEPVDPQAAMKAAILAAGGEVVD